MGGYQLIGNVLHYTGDGWVSCELTPKQIEEFKANTLDVLTLEWR